MKAPRTRALGRYTLMGEIASGGMGTVHLGRLSGPGRFSRTVAIKRLHPHLAKEPDFAAMFLDEARIAARIHHPNVAPVLDVVSESGELFLVMEYVPGESLARLLRAADAVGERAPLDIALAIVVDVLSGLHAAHEATDEKGALLNLIHRDVSPQNVLVGVDGVARLVDFGVARAAGRLVTTREGQIKGKLGYMAPEQLRGEGATRQFDVYSTAVVLWELLAGRRLFPAETESELAHRVLFDEVPPPSHLVPGLPASLDWIVLRGLARRRTDRFGTAREMALAIRDAAPLAPPDAVGAWVERLAYDALASRSALVASAPDEGTGEATSVDRTSISAATPEAGDLRRLRISAVTAAGLDGTSRPRRRRGVWIAFGGVLAAAFALGAITLGRVADAPAESASAIASAPARSTAAALDPAPPARVEIPAVSTTALPPSSARAAAPPRSFRSPALQGSSVTMGPQAAPNPGLPRSPARATSSANPCDAPYVRNAAGTKIFKRGCL